LLNLKQIYKLLNINNGKEAKGVEKKEEEALEQRGKVGRYMFISNKKKKNSCK
jgi:hypothetical protein